MDKLKRALSGNENDGDEERGFVAQVVEGSTLSWETRIKGFIICFVLGILCSVMGTLFLWLKNGLILFAVFYTVGNITALTSTCFLMGPMRQCRSMFAPTRIIATAIMLVSVLLTMLAAFVWKNNGLAIIFCVIEFLAMAWYSISYIPFARDAVKKCCEGCLG